MCVVFVWLCCVIMMLCCFICYRSFVLGVCCVHVLCLSVEGLLLWYGVCYGVGMFAVVCGCGCDVRFFVLCVCVMQWYWWLVLLLVVVCVVHVW